MECDDCVMQLAVLYPNSAATVNIRVTNSSDRIVRLRRRSVLARVDAVAEIFMQTDRSRDHILTVNLVSSLSLTLCSHYVFATPSVLCRLSLTFVHPTQRFELGVNIFTVLQSPDHVSGMICHLLCVHHPPH